MGEVHSKEELKRTLGLGDTTMVSVGAILGSGIFLVPATIAATIHSPMLTMGLWIVGGIISLFGALSVAELGAAMPRPADSMSTSQKPTVHCGDFSTAGLPSVSLIPPLLLRWVWRSGNILTISYPSQQAVFRWLLLYQLYS